MHACIHIYIHAYGFRRELAKGHGLIQTYMYMYMYAYMHAYIHIYIQAYMHAYIHIYIQAYMHAYIHIYIQAYMHAYIHIYIQAYGVRRKLAKGRGLDGVTVSYALCMYEWTHTVHI